MKPLYFIALLFLSSAAFGQDFIDPAKVKHLPHKPGIAGADSKSQISIQLLFKDGLKVVINDKSFKVVQFDLGYDCHSRSLVDFDTKRYKGDHVPGNDPYFRKRVLAGDVLIVANTIIERGNVRYRMDDYGALVLEL